MLRPSDAETDLIRACVVDEGQVGPAWDRFLLAVPDPTALFRADTGRRKRLAPLLLDGLRRGGVTVPGPLGTVLRTASFREGLRAEAYYGICRELTDALEGAGVPFLVMGGAALGLSVYDDPAQRHSHELDLLVAAGTEQQASAVLLASGLIRRDGDRPRHWMTLRHTTGMPVRIQASLLSWPFYRSDWSDVRDGAGPVALADGHVTVPGPAHAMARTAVEASYRPRQASLHWATDLVMLARRMTDADWTTLVRVARDAGLDLPMRLLLVYAAEALSAPVPGMVLDELNAPAKPLARDAALYAARTGPGGSVGDLLSRVRRPSDRLRLAAWLAVPSAEFVRLMAGETPASASRTWYGRQLLTRAARRILSSFGQPQALPPR